MNWLKRALQAAFLVIILGLGTAYLLPLLDAGEIGQRLLSLNGWLLFGLCPVLILISWGFRSLRWQVCLRLAGTDESLGRTHLVIGSVLGLAAITPMQGGEAAKILAVPNGARGMATGLFAAERLTDLAILAGLAALGALYIGMAIDWRLIAAGLAVIAALVTLAGLILRHLLSRSLFLEQALTGIAALLAQPRRLQAFLWCTFASWVAAACLWAAALAACSILLHPLGYLFVLGTATVTNMLTFVPGSLGVSEISIAAALILLGIAPEPAIAGALALRITGVEILALGGAHYLALLRTGGSLVFRVPES